MGQCIIKSSCTIQLHRLSCLSIEEHSFVLAQGELSYVLFMWYSKCRKIFFEMKQWLTVAQVQHFMLIIILRFRSKLELTFVSCIFYASPSIKFTKSFYKDPEPSSFQWRLYSRGTFLCMDSFSSTLQVLSSKGHTDRSGLHLSRVFTKNYSTTPRIPIGG